MAEEVLARVVVVQGGCSHAVVVAVVATEALVQVLVLVVASRQPSSEVHLPA